MWSRSAIYRRVPVEDEDEQGEEETRWRLVSLTLAKSTQLAPSLPTPHIVSVTVTGIGGTATFSDPDQMYDPRTLPQFPLGSLVTVKVVTDGTDGDQRAYLHFDVQADDRPRARRRPLLYNSADGAFEGTFVVREGFGLRHRHHLRPRSAIWVDVLTKATIYDTDPSIYAASGWGVPYRLLRPIIDNAPVATNR